MNLFPMLKTTHMHSSDRVYEVGRFSGETNPKGNLGKSSTPTMSMLENLQRELDMVRIMTNLGIKHGNSI